MQRASLIVLITLFHLLILQPLMAEVKLPAIVSSNMVLQRNTTVVLLGWANAKKITINAFRMDMYHK